MVERRGAKSTRTLDLVRFGGGDLGFGGAHNAINDFVRDSIVKNLACVYAHSHLPQERLGLSREIYRA